MTKSRLQIRQPDMIRPSVGADHNGMGAAVFVCLYFAPQALARLCASEAYAIFEEAKKLGPRQSLDVITRRDVFDAFVALNPSLLGAIKLKTPFLPSNI